MKRETGRERQARKRAERLREIADQVAAGRLVVRQATAEERERYGIKADARENRCR